MTVFILENVPKHKLIFGTKLTPISARTLFLPPVFGWISIQTGVVFIAFGTNDFERIPALETLQQHVNVYIREFAETITRKDMSKGNKKPRQTCRGFLFERGTVLISLQEQKESDP